MLPYCCFSPLLKQAGHGTGTSAATWQGWITAIPTAVLAAFAIVTAVFAYMALRKQSAEVASVVNESKRQAAERRRAQASRVFIFANPKPLEDQPISSTKITIHNTSQQPIYDLKLLRPDKTGQWIDVGGPVDLLVLMPGEQHPWGIGIEPSVPIQTFLGDPSVIKAAVDFRDAAGVHWHLQSDGQLYDLDEPVTE